MGNFWGDRCPLCNKAIVSCEPDTFMVFARPHKGLIIPVPHERAQDENTVVICTDCANTIERHVNGED